MQRQRHDGRSQLVARDIMQKRVISLKPNMTVREAAKVFLDNRITGAPVVERGKLVGVVSQTDLVRHANESAYGLQQNKGIPSYYQESLQTELPKGFQLEAPDYTRVCNVMMPAVFRAKEQASLQRIGHFMLRRHVHRVIVTSRGAMCGIITSMDVLQALLSTPHGRRRDQCRDPGRRS